MRPSRLIVGEVRQEECLDLLIALNSACVRHVLCPSPQCPQGSRKAVVAEGHHVAEADRVGGEDGRITLRGGENLGTMTQSSSDPPPVERRPGQARAGACRGCGCIQLVTCGEPF